MSEPRISDERLAMMCTYADSLLAGRSHEEPELLMLDLRDCRARCEELEAQVQLEVSIRDQLHKQRAGFDMLPEHQAMAPMEMVTLRNQLAAMQRERDEWRATGKQLVAQALEREQAALDALAERDGQVAALRAQLLRDHEALKDDCWEHRCEDGVGGCTAISATRRDILLEDILLCLAGTAAATSAFLAERDSRVRAEALDEAAKIADEHRERAKQMQADLLKKRDPVYGVGTADSARWDQFQHGAGAAAAVAAAIRAQQERK